MRSAGENPDKLGNPTSYYNGASYSFSWTKGRQLSAVLYGSVMTTYTYNADGIRTKKVGSSTVEYILDGTKIVAEKNGSRIIRYLYDAQDMPVGMILDGTTYLYEKNLQGDIVGIYNTSGTKIVTYAYDAWGNIISSSYTSGNQTVHDLNPFRYRGYYYDTETGFYYLQSRYYDPATGRFLNADAYVNANGDFPGFNMYAYCSNNPVMYVDYTGNTPGAIALFIIVSSIIGGIFGATIAVATGENVWEGLIEGMILGSFAAAATVYVPMWFPKLCEAYVFAKTGLTIGVAEVGGGLTDFLIQSGVCLFSGSNYSIDVPRIFKSAFTTAIASAAPTYGTPSKSVLNAFGSLAIGLDASAINAVIEII